MLEEFKPHTTIACSDLERAKAWYAEKLGLKPVSEDMGGAWYECAGANFALFPTPHAGTAKNTVMEWSVKGIEQVVKELKERGVVFDTFEMEGLTWKDDIASMGKYKGAWFKDSEGNILSLTE